MSLLYATGSKSDLVEYVNTGYLSDLHKIQSQSCYEFTSGNTTISWHSTKRSLIATFSNHAQIITIHEASQKNIWLKSMVQFIQKICGLCCENLIPIILYEDNVSYPNI